MTLRLDLSPQQADRLQHAAAKRGVDPVAYLMQLIDAPEAYGRADLASRGIGPEQAANLRARLRAMADDWDRPEMDGYDAL